MSTRVHCQEELQYSHQSLSVLRHTMDDDDSISSKKCLDSTGNFSSILEVDSIIGYDESIEVSLMEFESCGNYVDYEFLESTSDPLSYFPTEVSDLILQHLSGCDLLSASEVSLNWSQKLSQSEYFMSKIVLSIELSKLGESALKNLLAVVKSQRRYQNLQITLDNNKGIVKIIDWVLKKFAASIVNLGLSKTGGFNTMMNRPMPYTNLKSLELHVVCGRLSCDLSKVTTLKSLIVNGLSPAALVSCLKQNPHLKELSLYENSFITYFDEAISTGTSFKLKKLSILDHLRTGKALDGEFSASDWDGKHRINFLKLLESQAGHLKWLHLDTCRACDLNRIITSLPKLRFFELNKVTGDLDALVLDNNTNITTFIANTICDNLLCAIATSFLNLKDVFIEKIKTDQFFFLIRNSRRLKHFRYFWASASEKKNGPFVDLKRLYSRAEMCKSLRVCIKVVQKKVFFQKVLHK